MNYIEPYAHSAALISIDVQGMAELRHIGVSLMDSDECVAWIGQAQTSLATSDDACFD